MTITTCIFDAYGTLFDVAAAARLAAEEPGQDDWAAKWPALAADWRAKQLQYTWLRAITGEHCDFWQVTRDGLDWALERQELDGNPELRERLLALYWELQAYPEVPHHDPRTPRTQKRASKRSREKRGGHGRLFLFQLS